jgi:hypothetical protein
LEQTAARTKQDRRRCRGRGTRHYGPVKYRVAGRGRWGGASRLRPMARLRRPRMASDQLAVQGLTVGLERGPVCSDRPQGCAEDPTRLNRLQRSRFVIRGNMLPVPSLDTGMLQSGRANQWTTRGRVRTRKSFDGTFPTLLIASILIQTDQWPRWALTPLRPFSFS